LHKFPAIAYIEMGFSNMCVSKCYFRESKKEVRAGKALEENGDKSLFSHEGRKKK
jgi:hypothetical protein